MKIDTNTFVLGLAFICLGIPAISMAFKKCEPEQLPYIKSEHLIEPELIIKVNPLEKNDTAFVYRIKY